MLVLGNLSGEKFPFFTFTYTTCLTYQYPSEALPFSGYVLGLLDSIKFIIKFNVHIKK